VPGPNASPSAHSPSPLELDRRRYRRRQGTRSVLVSLASTLALAALVWVVVVDTPGWARVQQQFLDPGVLVDAWPRVFAGLLLNLRVLVAAAIGVLVLGLALAILRTLRGPVLFPLRALAAAYTDFFRGIPLIIVLYVVGFGIPGLQLTPRLPAEVWGTIALVLVYSAYVSEVIRAGIDAVHPSQVMSARSLGLTRGQALRVVILPQAVRKVTPALMNDFVAMQKDVGLVSVLGAVDAVRAAQLETAAAYNFTPYVLAGLLFVLLAVPTIRLTDWYAARVRRREQGETA
jgi:polar amino acid transport system permease protein